MRLSLDPRDEIRRVAFDASRERFPDEFTFDDMVDMLGHWRIRGIFDQGKCIGVVADHEGVVHVSILPEFRKRWATRNVLKEAIQGAMIDGKASTYLLSGDDYRAKFAERLGFMKTAEVNGVERYDYVCH